MQYSGHSTILNPDKVPSTVLRTMVKEEDVLPVKRQRTLEAQPSAVTAPAAVAGLSKAASGMAPTAQHQLDGSAKVVSPELVSTESTERLRELYQHASPYPHCVLKVGAHVCTDSINSIMYMSDA